MDAVMGDGAAPNLQSDDSFKRDSEVWFEDGNIVVIAQNTAFRVHKSVVSLHSPVFCDLFSIPQLPSTADGTDDETIDDCRVVRVSDTSYDVRELLRAIYYGGVSNVHPDEIIPFPVLAALARLSHKYQLDQLLAGVVERLKCVFTTQLDVWERASGFYRNSPLRLEPFNVIEALNLFRLLDRPEMIPVAVYECCQRRSSFLLHGVTRRDGVTRERLSPYDLELCLEVRGKLMQATTRLLTQLCQSYTARLLEASSNPGCLSPAHCLDRLRVVLDKCYEDLRDCIFADPFDTYYIAKLDCLCSVCWDVYHGEYTQLRKEVWGSLPRLAGVEVAEWGSKPDGIPTL